MALKAPLAARGLVTSAFVRDGAGVAVLGVITGQVAIGLGLIAVPKLYSPTAFGLATSIFNCAAVLSVVASFRLEVLLPSAPDRAVDVITRNAIALSAVLAIPLGIISCAAAKAWNLWGFATSCALILSIAAVGIAGFHNARLQQFRRTGLGKAAQGISQTGVLIGGGLAGGTAALAAFSFLSGYVVSAVTQLGHGFPARRPRSASVAVAVDWWKQAFLVLSALCNSTFVLGLVPLLAFFWGSADAGRVAIAQRLVTIPVALLVVALQPILLGRLSARWRVGDLGAAVLRRTMAKFSIVAVAYVICMIPLSGWALRASGSVAWSSAAKFVLPMCLLSAAQIAVNPLSMLPATLGNWRGQAAWDILRVICLLAVVAFLRVTDRPSLTAVWAATVVGVLFYIAQIPLIFSATTTSQQVGAKHRRSRRSQARRQPLA